MYCNEFPFPIIAVHLLTEGADTQFNTPFLVHQSVVSLAHEGTAADVIISKDEDGNLIPPELLFTPEKATIKSSETVSQAIRKHKVTLDFELRHTDYTEEQYATQIRRLVTGHYSLLITFFGDTQAIVRCDKHGDGFQYKHSEDKVLKGTITIENINGLQKVEWSE